MGPTFGAEFLLHRASHLRQVAVVSANGAGASFWSSSRRGKPERIDSVSCIFGGLQSRRASRSRSPTIAKRRSSNLKPCIDRTGRHGWSCCRRSSDTVIGARVSCCPEKATCGGTAA